MFQKPNTSATLQIIGRAKTLRRAERHRVGAGHG